MSRSADSILAGRRRRRDPEFMAHQTAAVEAWLDAHPEKRGTYQRAYEQRNPEKRAAYRQVKYALARGELVREPCLFCDAEKVEAHHHDYSLPLIVTWLCRRHHKIAHRKSVLHV